MIAAGTIPPSIAAPAPGDSSLPARVEQERARVLRAMGVIDCCRYAADSVLVATDSRPDTAAALEAAYDLLYQAAANLENIADHLARND